MTLNAPFRIDIIGENIISLQTEQVISETNHFMILSLQEFISSLEIPGLIEMVPAYCSITLYFDLKKILSQTSIAEIKNQIEKSVSEKWQVSTASENHSPVIEIPVCYDEEFATDMSILVEKHKIPAKEIIKIHSSELYRVYMVGFTPGFPYMGIVPGKIATPRKNKPAIRIPAGSVAIAAKQTGIYPVESPGGWNIIGRTPLKIFDIKRDDPFLLKTGNMVKFIPISKQQFLELNND